jgi:hypothetical protein
LVSRQGISVAVAVAGIGVKVDVTVAVLMIVGRTTLVAEAEGVPDGDGSWANSSEKTRSDWQELSKNPWVAKRKKTKRIFK